MVKAGTATFGVRGLRRWMLALLAAVLVPAVATPVAAQIGAEKTLKREGFQFPAGKQVRILVFRPDVSVGEQTTAGMNEPSAEWTETARRELAAALSAHHGKASNELVILPEVEGDDARLLADYRALFNVVTGTVIAHKMSGARLPTKKDKFDWTLGAEAARLGERFGGDYALMLYTQDSYGSAGRKALQAAFLLLGGGFVPSGVHVGYAGLVDLSTGDLVWLNADVAMGGDVRTPEGAAKRIAQLLEEFPLRAPGDPLRGKVIVGDGK